MLEMVVPATKSLINRFIPRKIKNIIINANNDRYYKPVLAELGSENNKKRIILIGTPEHGNLGDHLIAEAEHVFFQDYFSDYKIIEITGNHYRYQRNKILNTINESDIIAITGGGFLGSLWMIEEEMVRNIIKSFSDNKIVIFPSTIYFEDNEFGGNEFKSSKSIYSNHKDLTICVRDEESINIAKALLNKDDNTSKIIYTPDIALYINKGDAAFNRQGVLFCLREDKEKVLLENDKNIIEKIVRDKGLEIKHVSTVIPQHVRIEQRDNELEKLVTEFKKSQLVITDRLHGMVLATITGTPCIAMDNSSGKVQGVYSWIDFLNYIIFAKDTAEIPNLIDRLINMPRQSFSNKAIITAFEKIEKALKDEKNIHGRAN